MLSKRNRGRSEDPAAPRPAAAAEPVLEINGWALCFHPLFLDQLEKLVSAAEPERPRGTAARSAGPNSKLLAQVDRLIFSEIPEDPGRREYRQGTTLGDQRKHWFRAKFGGGRFRLFFRYRSDIRVVVYAWINDEETLRTYGRRTDAYAVFSRMLDAGNPPDSWDELMRSVGSRESVARAGWSLRRIGHEPEG